LILWKIQKFEEAKRYIDINKRLIEGLLEVSLLDEKESSLSVILESTD
jgi:hypothetical protein